MTKPMNTIPNVESPFSKYVRLHVEKRLPILERDEDYYSDGICGQDFWDSLFPGEQKLAGKCISQMVKKRILPLVIVEKEHEYPVCYQLK
jgi:hypothetical protein